MFDRCYDIVTTKEVQESEIEHVEKALARCGYPEWTFNKVKQQIKQKKETVPKQRKQKDPNKRSKCMVVIPYIKGVTEKLQRVYKKHNIATSVKPQRTIRNILVHPKDKIGKDKKTGVVYRIKCKICSDCYIGETGRQLNTRVKEHHTELENLPSINQTRSQHKESVTTRHKSAISDHACQQNHVIGWDNIDIIDREENHWHRQIRESIAIKQHRGTTMNRDDGSYELSRAWDSVIPPINLGGGARRTSSC